MKTRISEAMVVLGVMTSTFWVVPSRYSVTLFARQNLCRTQGLDTGLHFVVKLCRRIEIDDVGLAGGSTRRYKHRKIGIPNAPNRVTTGRQGDHLCIRKSLLSEALFEGI